MKRLLMAPLMALALVAFAASAASAQSISHTGPGSTNVIEHSNECDVDINNNTDIDINANTDQDANSGNASNSGNTSGGNATSGNASNNNSVSGSISVTNGGGGYCNPCCGYDDPGDTVSTPRGGDDRVVAQGDPEHDPQVIAPVGGINTGGGGATTPSTMEILGLVASFGLVAAGFWRVRKSAQLPT